VADLSQRCEVSTELGRCNVWVWISAGPNTGPGFVFMWWRRRGSTGGQDVHGAERDEITWVIMVGIDDEDSVVPEWL
jgi:hypothetical protein